MAPRGIDRVGVTVPTSTRRRSFSQHLACYVDDLDTAVARAEAAGAVRSDRRSPCPARKRARGTASCICARPEGAAGAHTVAQRS